MEGLQTVVQTVIGKMTNTQESEDILMSEDEILRSLLLDRGLGLRHTYAEWGNIKESWKKKTEGFLKGQSYYLWGGAGTGKTYLAAAMMKEYMRSGVLAVTPVQKNGVVMMRMPKECRFVPMVDLLMEIKASFESGSTECESNIIHRYADTPCLILDDIGVEKTTEWTLQIIYTIIDRRYREMKQTVITSNIDIQGLKDKLGERIPSRITEMCGKENVLNLSGKDRRVGNINA